mmetsp:Transcript_18592/g.54447  ORF Transcript_18592/g.54447 Transcript_18592/m.54447 type:complete len:236 (+) Transcript_18592:441-1148(+)
MCTPSISASSCVPSSRRLLSRALGHRCLSKDASGDTADVRAAAALVGVEGFRGSLAKDAARDGGVVGVHLRLGRLLLRHVHLLGVGPTGHGRIVGVLARPGRALARRVVLAEDAAVEPRVVDHARLVPALAEEVSGEALAVEARALHVVDGEEEVEVRGRELGADALHGLHKLVAREHQLALRLVKVAEHLAEHAAGPLAPAALRLEALNDLVTRQLVLHPEFLDGGHGSGVLRF